MLICIHQVISYKILLELFDSTKWKVRSKSITVRKKDVIFQKEKNVKPFLQFTPCFWPALKWYEMDCEGICECKRQWQNIWHIHAIYMNVIKEDTPYAVKRTLIFPLIIISTTVLCEWVWVCAHANDTDQRIHIVYVKLLHVCKRYHSQNPYRSWM